MMDNMEMKVVGSEEMEKVSGGDNPTVYNQQVIVGYPGAPVYPMPVNPNYPGQGVYPPPAIPSRPPIAFNTRCCRCGRTSTSGVLPNGMRTGAAFCSCGGRMEDVEPIFG